MITGRCSRFRTEECLRIMLYYDKIKNIKLMAETARNRIYGRYQRMGKTFEEMQEMYREVVRRFNKIELREWNAQGAMIELSKQVGELAKQVMRLADCYQVDLERAFLLAREDEDQYLISRGV